MDRRAFVIGLSGVPGAGKSTLAAALGARVSAPVVQYDQFQPLTRMAVEDVRGWFRRGGDPNEFPLKELIRELERRTHWPVTTRVRPTVIFETPFGRLHRDSGAFIDFLVWLDTPLDLALARALGAILEGFRRQGPPPASSLIDWQRNYLTNYPIVRDMYLAQRASVVADAQLVVDGAAPPSALVEEVQAALNARVTRRETGGGAP